MFKNIFIQFQDLRIINGGSVSYVWFTDNNNGFFKIELSLFNGQNIEGIITSNQYEQLISKIKENILYA